MLENGERGSGEIERHRAATRLWEIAAQRTAKSLTHLIKCNDIQLFAQQNMYNETRNLHAELRVTHTESHFHFSFFIFHISGVNRDSFNASLLRRLVSTLEHAGIKEMWTTQVGNPLTP